MCRISLIFLGVTKLDHIQGQHIRGTVTHKRNHCRGKVKNVCHDRDDWFTNVHAQNKRNVVRKSHSMDWTSPRCVKREEQKPLG